MTNPIIQTDIAEILREIQSNQKEILKEIGDVKLELKGDINQLDLKTESIKGDIKALSEKVSGIDSRLANVETSVQKIPDLAEKVGEFKWWKQTVLILSSGTVGAFIAKFLGNQNP
jgi:seryl-tRNA synthetase